MSSSFPFFQIAKDCKVPYAKVMQVWSMVTENDLSLNYWKEIPGLEGWVAKAELAERQRRLAIEMDQPIPRNWQDRDMRKFLGL